MDLRPELTPPVLDDALVARLSALADRLDSNVERYEELEEFNRLAGTSLTLGDFQGIYKSVDPEEFVCDVLYRRSIRPVTNLSRAEMIEIVARLKAWDAGHDFYLSLFQMYCKHPSETDLLYYPQDVPELPKDREPTLEEIADCALNWKPRVVAMVIKQRSGGTSVPYYIYNLEAPDTPKTQVVTSLDAGYDKGRVVAVALKGVQLEDGTVVDKNFDYKAFSCGKILGYTEKPIGTVIG